MSIDLSRLTPAPWFIDAPWVNGPHVIQQVWHGAGEICCALVCECENGDPSIKAGDPITDAAFVALARNAFDGDPDALAWWESNRRRRDGHLAPGRGEDMSDLNRVLMQIINPPVESDNREHVEGE